MKGKGFIYIPKFALVYARIPKCANTSIKTRLAELVLTKRVTHRNQARDLQPTNDRFWKKCTNEAQLLRPDRFTAIHDAVTSFTVIREPLGRLHSCYREKVLRETVFPPMERLGYRNTMTFADFLDLTCALEIDAMDVHTQPQTFLISDSKGRLPNFIGLLDNLDADWARLSRLMEAKGVSLGGPLPRLNSSRASPGKVDSAGEMTAIPASTRRQVELTYGADIKLYERLHLSQAN